MVEMIDANLETGFFDARDARRNVPAQVSFEGRGITLITTDNMGEPVLWHGERRGQGHYVLSAPAADMDASMHRFADSMILEGFWRHGMERGFWRLHLPVNSVTTKTKRVAKLVAVEVKPRAKAPRKRIRRAA